MLNITIFKAQQDKVLTGKDSYITITAELPDCLAASFHD